MRRADPEAPAFRSVVKLERARAEVHVLAHYLGALAAEITRSQLPADELREIVADYRAVAHDALAVADALARDAAYRGAR